MEGVGAEVREGGAKVVSYCGWVEAAGWAWVGIWVWCVVGIWVDVEIWVTVEGGTEVRVCVWVEV